MGADIAPASIFEAVRSLSREFVSGSSVVFFAVDPVIEDLKKRFCKELLSLSTFRFQPCLETIEMHDTAVEAVKAKKQSTLVQGIESLKEGKIDAFISCGNTGALVAASYLYLGTFPSISRPALVSLFPSKKKEVVVLDLGATTSPTPQQMLQQAFLGAAYAHYLKRIKQPKVALLNIGTEPEKGDELLKKSWQLLSQTSSEKFVFVGNREPKDVFLGEIDVFITPGLIGNIFLKTAEAAASFILDRAKTGARYQQGAIVLGVRGLVIKCHGDASEASIQEAVIQAHKLFAESCVSQIENFLEKS